MEVVMATVAVMALMMMMIMMVYYHWPQRHPQCSYRRGSSCSDENKCSCESSAAWPIIGSS